MLWGRFPDKKALAPFWGEGIAPLYHPTSARAGMSRGPKARSPMRSTPVTEGNRRFLPATALGLPQALVRRVEKRCSEANFPYPLRRLPARKSRAAFSGQGLCAGPWSSSSRAFRPMLRSRAPNCMHYSMVPARLQGRRPRLFSTFLDLFSIHSTPFLHVFSIPGEGLYALSPRQFGVLLTNSQKYSIISQEIAAL